MTEKHYGGTSDFGVKNASSKKQSREFIEKDKKNNANILSDSKVKNLNSSQEEQEILKLKKAGSIASQVKEYAKTIVKPGLPLLEIAEKIEAKILELGAAPAFPVNLSINEIAAHFTPAHDSKDLAHGLLKIDLGCHIDGFIADTAFSIDLDNSQENKSLIEASESALKRALELVKHTSLISQLGEEIENMAKKKGFITIRNLSGHSISPWELHSGVTIPNFNNSSNSLLQEGVYAIEPFSTNGSGLVKDGKLSGIYQLENNKSVRDSKAREVLEFISSEYKTLPFCSRWIFNKFGSRGLLALRQIESAGLLHHYPQLVESSKGKVAQTEQTILVTKDKVIVTTS